MIVKLAAVNGNMYYRALENRVRRVTGDDKASVPSRVSYDISDQGVTNMSMNRRGALRECARMAI